MREPVLLIHGFASTLHVNWVAPAGSKTLSDAGYRVDRLRQSRPRPIERQSYDPQAYTPERMAGDAAALLAHLGIRAGPCHGLFDGRAHRAPSWRLSHPERVATLVFGGLGIGMVDGVGDWDPIAEALLAPDPAAITASDAAAHVPRLCRPDQERPPGAGRLHRHLAHAARARTRWRGSPSRRWSRVGTKDDIAGSPQALAALMPNAEAFDIEGRDHMLAVGDRTLQGARCWSFCAPIR